MNRGVDRVPTGGGGSSTEEIHTAWTNLAGITQLTFLNLTRNRYRIDLDFISPAASTLTAQTSSNNGGVWDSGGADYAPAQDDMHADNAGAPVTARTASGSLISINGSATINICALALFFDPASGLLYWRGGLSFNGTTDRIVHGWGKRSNVASVPNALQLTTAAAFTSGLYRCVGYL